MLIGIPKEIKISENRVGMVPTGVKQLVHDGNKVFVQSGAGMGIGISDQDYINAGATILPTLKDVFEAANLIIKVKEPQREEVALLKPKHILYTYLHLAADIDLTKALMETGSTCVAYETIQLDDLSLPLLIPMSEVAGRMATQIGAAYLQSEKGGKGILLGGVPGVRRGKVTVIGCGIAGTNAIKMAMGLGASVTAIDVSGRRLAQLDDLFESRITTLYSNMGTIEKAVSESDLVIGAALIPGAKAPKLVTKEMISKMQKGSVVIDIAIDQGGCIETCRPTTHENPTYLEENVIHYCVPNMPGVVARTATYGYVNAAIEYILEIANLGVDKAIENPAIEAGVITYKGELRHLSLLKNEE